MVAPAQVAPPTPHPSASLQLVTEQAVAAEEAAAPLTLETFAATLANGGELMLASLLRREARVVAIDAGRLVLQRCPAIGDAEAAQIGSAYSRVTRAAMTVTLADSGGAPTLAQSAAQAGAEAEQILRQHPLVAAAFEVFPDAELVRTPRAANGN